jgi:hypothetical protein
MKFFRALGPNYAFEILKTESDDYNLKLFLFFIKALFLLLLSESYDVNDFFSFF